jgi:hypothetical protein
MSRRAEGEACCFRHARARFATHVMEQQHMV